MVVLIAQSRVLFAMGRDGLLPSWLGRVSPAFQSPSLAAATAGLAATALALYPKVGSLEQLLVIGSLAAFFSCSVGVIVLRRSQPDLERGFRVAGAPLVPALGALATAWLGLNLTTVTWRNFAVWTAIGLVLYLGYGRWHSVLARREEHDDDHRRGRGPSTARPVRGRQGIPRAARALASLAPTGRDGDVRFPREDVGGAVQNGRMTTTTAGIPGLDTESCYSAVKSRDRRFDGVFYIAVRTTGIYCRPSCPARTPALQNVTFHRSAAAAQAAGYRACKRCLPDATPGSPDWDAAATVAGRAMRLIADGVVDREGVDGLARRLGYTARHLSRVLAAELGAGPLALARAQRAQTARVLVETTDLSFADIAFASGFASVRQFNDTVREVYAATPTQLRGRRGGARTPGRSSSGSPYARRSPAPSCCASSRSVRSKVSRWRATAGTPARSTCRTARHGPDRARRRARPGPDGPGPGAVRAARPARHRAAVARVRRLLDGDCDPIAVADHFAGDSADRPARTTPPRPAGARPRRR